MSKFIDDALFTLGENRRSKTTPLRIKFRQQEDFMRCQTEYKIIAAIEQHGFVDEMQTGVTTDLLRTFRRKIYDEVFGDFYEKLYILERAILEEDFNAARVAMSEVWREARP